MPNVGSFDVIGRQSLVKVSYGRIPPTNYGRFRTADFTWLSKAWPLSWRTAVELSGG